jgi:hypothetical protein
LPVEPISFSSIDLIYKIDAERPDTLSMSGIASGGDSALVADDGGDDFVQFDLQPQGWGAAGGDVPETIISSSLLVYPPGGLAGGDSLLSSLSSSSSVVLSHAPVVVVDVVKVTSGGGGTASSVLKKAIVASRAVSNGGRSASKSRRHEGPPVLLPPPTSRSSTGSSNAARSGGMGAGRGKPPTRPMASPMTRPIVVAPVTPLAITLSAAAPAIIAAATGIAEAPEALLRAQAKAKNTTNALKEAAAASAAMMEKGGTAAEKAAARAATMAAAQAAIKNMKLSAKGPQLSEAPHAIRAKLEMARFIANGQLHKSITFEHRVEERRVRLEGLTSSVAEADRMKSVHSAQREETRRSLLRETIRKERAMLDVLKKEGVKNFAGLADAMG